MFGKRRLIADAESFSSNWAPVVLRFFQLFVGDHALAESLAIDTLAEHVCDRAPLLDKDEGVELLRRALKKGVKNDVATIEPTDLVVQAVTSLPARQRAVVVLLRGLSLDPKTVARVVGLDLAEVRQLWLDGLIKLHRTLSSVNARQT